MSACIDQGEHLDTTGRNRESFIKRDSPFLCVFALVLALALALPLAGCEALPFNAFGTGSGHTTAPEWFDLASVPEYDGQPSVEVNGNEPFFEEADFERPTFEEYSELDARGRCGTAFALIGSETMPTEPRGDISSIRPSGWHNDTYDWVDQYFLFNRCHVIGWQLAGENDNELNLITGTRYMNTQGMLPYENRVAWYVQSTGNHVLYRVTPIFEGANLVCSGVLMEAESVEDIGQGVRFCVYCYNVEPGVRIDYATGANKADGTMGETSGEHSENTRQNDEAQSSTAESREEPSFTIPDESKRAEHGDVKFVLNVSTGKFHLPHCPSVTDMREYNKFLFNGTREEAIELGFKPCGSCKP